MKKFTESLYLYRILFFTFMPLSCTFVFFFFFPAWETRTMKRSDEAGRISRLCAALGRITASLDPETVLREIV